MVHYRGGNSSIDHDVYPDLDEFWTDLTAAYNAQMRGVYELGGRYLQLDDTAPGLHQRPGPARAHRGDRRRPRAPARAVHPQHQPGAGRAARRSRVTTHLCRGNNQSMWAAEGGYDFVAEALFNDLEVDGYFLEYDDERSGTFEPLRFVPKGKLVVLGLVTTKSPRWRTRISSSAGSRRPRGSWTSTSCACLRSAGSPRPKRATS
jgi:5-methyltetrahydropteroyltriglutamate--homocysteine methyltransferase